ncbi:MAG: formylglycine-generating enzyme family protein, partial [Planctomycetota bacterium]
IDKYEITQSQFQRFVKATGYKTLAEKEGFSYQWNGREWQKISGISWKNPFPKGIAEEIYFARHPVVHVSWVDCVEYAKWAGGKLPSEAQWERAARGEDKRKYPWGNEWPQGTYFANATFHRSWEYIELDGYPYTAPVGSFVTGVSPYGCMDMSGNVWEWCQDDWETLWYQRLFRESRGQQRVYENLVNQGVGKYKSIRGGGWTPTPRDFRVTSRGRNHPHYRAGDLGFRLVVPGIE